METTNPRKTEPQVGTQTTLKRRRRWWVRIILYPVLAYAAWCATLYVVQDTLIFPRDQAPAPLPRPPRGNIHITRLDLDKGGYVESWFLPAPGVTAEQPGPLVLFFHGNAELIDYQDDIVRAYHRLGISVYLPEYRGYGLSAGRPSQQAIREDCVRFYDQVVNRPDVDASSVIFHGRSLGGGVACDLAAQRKPTVIILQSTFSSLAVMAHGYGAPTFLVRHPFRNDRVLAALDVPVLIFHGTRDRIIPVWHGRRLHEVDPQSQYVEYDCGHNDWPGRNNEEASWRRIEEFLQSSGIIQPAEDSNRSRGAASIGTAEGSR